MENRLQKLNILEGFKELKPISYEGQQFKKMYENVDSSNYMSVATMLIAGSKIRESRISNWCKQKQIKISKTIPINMQIGYALDEALNTPFGNTIVDELGYLRNLNEADLKSSIGNGILEQYIDISPRLKALHESICKINSVSPTNSTSHVCFNPISYIYENAGKQYFMVEGKCFCYSKEKVSESQIPNATFEKVNMAIQETPFDSNAKIFSLTMLPGAINITKKGKVTINGEEVTGKKFNTIMGIALNECMNQELKNYNARMADNINLIMENFENLCELDIVDTCKNTSTNESISLIHHDNGYLIYEHTNSSDNCFYKTSINESINYIKKYTGINLYKKYANKALNEANDVNAVNKALKEQVDIKKEIEKSLALLEDEIAILNIDSPKRVGVERDIEQLKEELEIANSNISNYNEILSMLS